VTGSPGIGLDATVVLIAVGISPAGALAPSAMKMIPMMNAAPPTAAAIRSAFSRALVANTDNEFPPLPRPAPDGPCDTHCYPSHAHRAAPSRENCLNLPYNVRLPVPRAVTRS
jgi:hypothetical protein